MLKKKVTQKEKQKAIATQYMLLKKENDVLKTENQSLKARLREI